MTSNFLFSVVISFDLIFTYHSPHLLIVLLNELIDLIFMIFNYFLSLSHLVLPNLP